MAKAADQYKKAIEAMEALYPKVKFIIRPIKKHSTGYVLWEVKTMDTVFRGKDFVETARDAVRFAVKAHGIEAWENTKIKD